MSTNDVLGIFNSERLPAHNSVFNAQTLSFIILSNSQQGNELAYFLKCQAVNMNWYELTDKNAAYDFF